MKITPQRARDLVLAECRAHPQFYKDASDYLFIGTIWQETGFRGGYRRLMCMFKTKESAEKWLKNQADYYRARIHAVASARQGIAEGRQ